MCVHPSACVVTLFTCVVTSLFWVATVPLETEKHWFKIEGTSMCGYPSTSHFLETIKHWFKMKVPACVVTLSRVMGTSLDNGPP